MCQAVIYGNVEIVKFLLEKGANVDVQDSIGCAAIHYAVTLNNLTVFEALMDHDARLDIIDRVSMIYIRKNLSE